MILWECMKRLRCDFYFQGIYSFERKLEIRILSNWEKRRDEEKCSMNGRDEIDFKFIKFLELFWEYWV